MDNVKAKIIELIPDKECPVEAEGNHCPTHCLRLADVLRAISIAIGKNVSRFELKWNNDRAYFIKFANTEYFKFIAEWNLLEHYDNQTPELKAFVGKLLGVTG